MPALNKLTVILLIIIIFLLATPAFAGNGEITPNKLQSSVETNAQRIPLQKGEKESTIIPIDLNSNTKLLILPGKSDNSLFKIFLTAALTIIGSVIVFVIGEILSKFFIDPIKEQKALIGKVEDELTFYANVYCNPNINRGNRTVEAEDKIRQLSTLLRSKTQIIPCYSLWGKLRLIPTKKNINLAASELIGLSNSIRGIVVDGTTCEKMAYRARLYLGIYIPPEMADLLE